jgi:hypothetical protein
MFGRKPTGSVPGYLLTSLDWLFPLSAGIHKFNRNFPAIFVYEGHAYLMFTGHFNKRLHSDILPSIVDIAHSQHL